MKHSHFYPVVSRNSFLQGYVLSSQLWSFGEFVIKRKSPMFVRRWGSNLELKRFSYNYPMINILLLHSSLVDHTTCKDQNKPTHCTIQEENFHFLNITFAHFANGKFAKFKFRLLLQVLKSLSDSLYKIYD